MSFSVQIVIPTRNRPQQLRNCLKAIANGQNPPGFTVLVCDSSDDARHAAVQAVADDYPFALVRRHGGKNVAAARNACAKYATADVLVNVDDDVYVDPNAITELVDCWRDLPQPAVAAGSVFWPGGYSRPVVMRHIGYGRSMREGETPSFLIGAFFVYARNLALSLPWNENIRTSDDRFMGALWRSHKVFLGYCAKATATHDASMSRYGVGDQADHIYANLFDALMANPSLVRALSYDFVGFGAGLKTYGRSPSELMRYLAAWIDGHRKFVRDYRVLRNMVSAHLSGDLRTVS